MFFSVSLCSVSLREEKSGDQTLRPGHYVAAGADLLLGIALLAIGLFALLFNFFPVPLKFAMIGVGATYTFGLLCALGFLIKHALAPDKFLI